jgi:hypothetical protein
MNPALAIFLGLLFAFAGGWLALVLVVDQLGW